MDSNLKSYCKCNNVNCSNQSKRYSLRKTKALSEKLKKVNLPCSITIFFKDSNKCAVLEFINSAHYTGAFNLFKESYPIKENTDVTGVLVEATAAIESPRVSVHWYLTQDKCMFQGPTGEVASLTEEFIHSLPNLQLFSNETNLPKQMISMYFSPQLGQTLCQGFHFDSSRTVCTSKTARIPDMRSFNNIARRLKPGFHSSVSCDFFVYTT